MSPTTTGDRKAFLCGIRNGHHNVKTHNRTTQKAKIILWCSRHDIITILDKRRTSCVWSDEKETT